MARKRKPYTQYKASKKPPGVWPGNVLNATVHGLNGGEYRLHEKYDTFYIWPQGYSQFSRRLWEDGKRYYVWWYGHKYYVTIRIKAKRYKL